jgi:hypothetical protein
MLRTQVGPRSRSVSGRLDIIIMPQGKYIGVGNVANSVFDSLLLYPSASEHVPTQVLDPVN